MEKVMTDIDIKSADMDEGVSKIAKKVLTYIMDGPLRSTLKLNDDLGLNAQVHSTLCIQATSF